MRYETFSDKRATFVGVNPPGSGNQFPLLREGDNDFLALSGNVPAPSGALQRRIAVVSASRPPRK